MAKNTRGDKIICGDCFRPVPEWECPAGHGFPEELQPAHNQNTIIKIKLAQREDSKKEQEDYGKLITAPEAHKKALGKI